MLLSHRYQTVRAFTESLCEPLEQGDYGIQSMPDVSPPKWHLGHTTWFFENFLLSPHQKDFRAFHTEFSFIFNSYYNSAGPFLERSARGLLSRPTTGEIFRYRHLIDERVLELIDSSDAAQLEVIEPIIVLGLHHEQQHQELLLTDIKNIFWSNPMRPRYVPRTPPLHQTPGHPASSSPVLSFDGGLFQIGAPDFSAKKTSPFAFDNERLRHRVFLESFSIRSAPVTCGEYLEFIEAGGYGKPAHWLSDGWDSVKKNKWTAPLYWEKQDHRWFQMTLNGMMPLDEHEPVCHLSYYEADAYARWRGVRLPTEAEWEHAAESNIGDFTSQARFVENGRYHPLPSTPGFFGNVWEWTASPYVAYPGFKLRPTPWSEYNAKFMCNQFVLRGGSCATSRSHIRATYRNYFPPAARWQFSGLRLAT